MSLRTRLFLTLCGLLAASTVAQVLLVRSLSADLDREVDSMALFVGSRVAQVVAADLSTCPEGESCPAPSVSWISGELGSEEGSSADIRLDAESFFVQGNGSFEVYTGSGPLAGSEVAGPEAGESKEDGGPDASGAETRRVARTAATVTTIRVDPRPETRGSGEAETTAEDRNEGEEDQNEGKESEFRSVFHWVFEHDDDSPGGSGSGDTSETVIIPIGTTTAPCAPSILPPKADGTPDGDSARHSFGTSDQAVVIPAPVFSSAQVHGPHDAGARISSHGSPGTSSTFVHRMRTGPDHAHDHDHAGEGEGFQQTIQLHVDSHSDGHFLMVQRPDLVGRVPIPQSGLRERLDTFRQRLLLGSASLFFLGLIIAAAIAQRMTAPLRTLSAASTEIAEGALGVRVPEDSADRDLRLTLGAFNHMSSKLAELDARNRELQAARHMGEIGDIARGLAHSLRNPLNALGLSVEELAGRAAPGGEDPGSHDAPEPSASHRLAESARRQIRRLDEGIRSFLLLASQSGGAVEPIDVAELVRDVGLEAIQTGGHQIRLDLRIDTEAEEEGLFGLPAVAPELRAVLQALVVNALEASPAGEQVGVHLERVEGDGTDGETAAKIRLTVEDRGAGFAPEIRERLFTPHLSTKPNGSGMGLFLAHRITHHRYGGRVEVFDREGGGSRVVLHLGPRRQTETSDTESAARTEAEAETEPGVET